MSNPLALAQVSLDRTTFFLGSTQGGLDRKMLQSGALKRGLACEKKSPSAPPCRLWPTSFGRCEDPCAVRIARSDGSSPSSTERYRLNAVTRQADRLRSDPKMLLLSRSTRSAKPSVRPAWASALPSS